MRCISQATSGRVVTVTVDAARLRRSKTHCSPSTTPQSVADRGKIRLGGAFRLPVSRKTI